MSDIKPISTLQLASGLLSLVKTGTIIFVMLMLEWARLREKKAKLEAAGAVNDLELEKIKSEAKDDERDNKQVLDDFLAADGLPPSTTGKS